MTYREMINELTARVQQNFRTFGGERDLKSSNNPLVHWMNDDPPSFALGVDVGQVVAFVLDQAAALRKRKPRAKKGATKR